MHTGNQRPKHISDQQLLEWIEDGSLRITHLSSKSPRLTFRGRRIRPRLAYSGGGNDRYRWHLHDRYTVRRGRRRRIRRTIARSKLVWMYVNRQLVPEDHFIHHIDLDRFNDRASNLEAISEPEHNGVHYGEEF